MDDRLWKWRKYWKIRGIYGLRFQTLREAEEYLRFLDDTEYEATDTTPMSEDDAAITAELDSGGEPGELSGTLHIESVTLETDLARLEAFYSGSPSYESGD